MGKHRAKATKLKPYTKGLRQNVLAIADTHLPFCKPGYLEFVREQQEKYKCGTVVHIGDEVDLCATSAWEKDPDGLSPASEYDLALAELLNWYKVFPDVRVCIGNHSERIFRLARTAGISKKFLKTYEEIWQAPKGWKWDTSFEINGTVYSHGTGTSGPDAAIKRAAQIRQNCVIGHIHTEAGVRFNASNKDLIWGMMLGGAIDDKQYAFAYARENIKKSIVGCGVILNQTPIYIPMIL